MVPPPTGTWAFTHLCCAHGTRYLVKFPMQEKNNAVLFVQVARATVPEWGRKVTFEGHTLQRTEPRQSSLRSWVWLLPKSSLTLRMITEEASPHWRHLSRWMTFAQEDRGFMRLLGMAWDSLKLLFVAYVL